MISEAKAWDRVALGPGLFQLIVTATGVILVSIAILFALTFRPGNPNLWRPAEGEPAIPVYVVQWGVHVDLVAARKDLLHRHPLLDQALARIGDGPYVTLGFGDAKAYVSQAPWTPGRILDGARALLAPHNPAVVRFEPRPHPPGDDEQALSFRLSPRAFAKLSDRLAASLAAPAGHVALLPSSSGDGGRYFRSAESFDLGHDCGEWASDLLGAAGAPQWPLTDAFPTSFMTGLKLRTARM